MTLDPNQDVVAQIIESYKGYAATLSSEKRKRFNGMLNNLYEFIEAINVKAEPFAEEAAIVSLLLKQHLIIEDLKQEVAKLKGQQGQK